MVTAAPVVESEMADWVALGGGNSGIVGDANHTYGFHCAAQDISPDDYSRWRDPNGADGPFVDWSYACAGDFSHGNDPALRAYHVSVLQRLMAGEMPMVCEFIGKPWADQPVLYWARWNGIETLQKYTGSGHDTWSHISWYRSRVNERANLWTGGDDVTAQENWEFGIQNPSKPPGTMEKAETYLAYANMYAYNAANDAKKAVAKLDEVLALLKQQGGGGTGGGLTFDQTVEAARQGAELAEDS